jgi:hypothetical protein
MTRRVSSFIENICKLSVSKSDWEDFEISMQEGIVMRNVGVNDLYSSLNTIKAVKGR